MPLLALTENERKAGVQRKSIEYMTMSEALYEDAKDVAHVNIFEI